MEVNEEGIQVGLNFIVHVKNVKYRLFPMNPLLKALMCLLSSLDVPVVSKMLKIVLNVTRQLFKSQSSFFQFSLVSIPVTFLNARAGTFAAKDNWK